MFRAMLPRMLPDNTCKLIGCDNMRAEFMLQLLNVPSRFGIRTSLVSTRSGILQSRSRDNKMLTWFIAMSDVYRSLCIIGYYVHLHAF
jgi:hypothetical protein